MVVVRLRRQGAKGRPFFHVVVLDKRSSRDGKFIEILGYVNYFAAVNETSVCMDLERLSYWVSQGAQISAPIKRLSKKAVPRDSLRQKKFASSQEVVASTQEVAAVV